MVSFLMSCAQTSTNASQSINATAFKEAIKNKNIQVLDVRTAAEFNGGHIQNALQANWLDQKEFTDRTQHLDKNLPVYVYCQACARSASAQAALEAKGYKVINLEGGMSNWINAGKEIDSTKRISANEFADKIETTDSIVIDVRKKSEFDSEHIINSINVPLNQINAHLSSIPKDENFIVICAGGYRSMIAASILRQRGWNNFVDVEGGFAEIKKTNAPRTNFVCPTTLL
jgi:rhodanese-related sulfurtransferase